MSLETKSITELRAMLSAMGGGVNFGDKKNVLIQKINLKLEDKIKPQEVIHTAVPDDQRLRTVPPAKNMSPKAVEETLQPFIDKGLRFSVSPDGTWNMRYGKKEDSGSFRVPLRVIVNCARSITS